MKNEAWVITVNVSGRKLFCYGIEDSILAYKTRKGAREAIKRRQELAPALARAFPWRAERYALANLK